MIEGGRITQIVCVAAELGIPELLKDGPRTNSELAEASDSHGPTLHRFMRALEALGLVGAEPAGYVLTPLGAALRSDVPERLDLFARYVGHDTRWRTWGHLLYSIRTGRAAFPDLFGMTSWEYGERHPDLSQLFNEMMTVGSKRRQAAILAAYDFSRLGVVVDVGGGHGQLLGATLQRYLDLRGVLSDQPHVIAGAAEVLASLDVEERVTTVGGSFFETVPPGGDAYILKAILHDWDDDPTIRILRTVHRAAEPGATLLVIERVLPEDGPPEVGAAIMDLHMLVQVQGKERTESEFRSLFERAGFRLTRVVSTTGDVSIIEGVRAATGEDGSSNLEADLAAIEESFGVLASDDKPQIRGSDRPTARW
jgi:hypothetical protein